MTTQRIKRKLAAVLHMDVKGYSRLMGQDEVGTLSTLTTYRDVLYGMVQLHGGRVVDTAGDAFLVEFASVVDAISCAVEFQNEIRARNEKVPEDRKMEFRIGINVGDVIEDEDNIYGDGVNIAARLEALAEPGGICISGTAYDQLKRKLSLDYEFMGEKEVKNIAEPVRTYRVCLGPQQLSAAESRASAPVAPRIRSIAVPVAIAIVVLLVAGALGWRFLVRPFHWAPVSHTERSARSMNATVVSTPAIAVLPFTDPSGNTDRQRFAAGFSRALVGTLCRTHGVDVIAARSASVAAGKTQDVMKAAKKLDASHVVTGSIRTEGQRVLVSVGITTAGNNAQIWSRQYDRAIQDVSALQSEVALDFLSGVGARISDPQKKLITDASLPTRNQEAYDAYVQALSYDGRMQESESERAEALLEKAVTLDPQFAQALVDALVEMDQAAPDAG